MKRKWIKLVSWVLLTPLMLFVILMALLYVPPIQNYLRGKVEIYASEKTNMQVQIRRIDLRFPLNLQLQGVRVIQLPDTLLALERLNAKVEVLPLFSGKIALKDLTFNQVAVNSLNLIQGLRIKGYINYFHLKSHAIDLPNEMAIIDRAEFENSNLQLYLNDTAKVEEDSVPSEPIKWKIDLRRFELKNVSFAMHSSADSVQIMTHFPKMVSQNLFIDLKKQSYDLKHFSLLDGAFSYSVGYAVPSKGFDFSHIAVKKVRIQLDSLSFHGKRLNAVISHLSLNERSGLSVSSLKGRFSSDNRVMEVPYLNLTTPNSELNFNAKIYWPLIGKVNKNSVNANLNAYIGREDLLLFAGTLSKEFMNNYPFRPLTVYLGAEGNWNQIRISRCAVDLPGAFTMRGKGYIENATDSLNRVGNLEIDANAKDLNFLTSLAGVESRSFFNIPDSIRLAAKVDFKGAEYKADLQLSERRGMAQVKGNFNSLTEVYKAEMRISQWQLHDFLPQYKFNKVSLSASANGRGLDLMSKRSYSSMKVTLDSLYYGRMMVSNIVLDGEIKSALAKVNLNSNNTLLNAIVDAEYNLAHSYPDGKISVDLKQINFYEMGLVNKPLKRPLSFTLMAESSKNLIQLQLKSGDLSLNFRSSLGIYSLINESQKVAALLSKQIKEKRLNHLAIKKALPEASLSFYAGKENLIAYFLETKNVRFDEIVVDCNLGTYSGIKSNMGIFGFKTDSTQLDTISFTATQDTSKLDMCFEMSNGDKNPKTTFNAQLKGEIRSYDAQLMAEFKNNQRKTGLLLGVNASLLPNTSFAHFDGDGVTFTLIPKEPIIAFTKFKIVKDHNWVYLDKNMHAYANLHLKNNTGMVFRAQSVLSDMTSLQNVNIELSKINLEELMKTIPYAPKLTGLFSADMHYIQTTKNLQLSGEASIEKLTYESDLIGDISIGATWLPSENNSQYLDAYMSHNGSQVLTANGTMKTTATGKDSIGVKTSFKEFPLSMANGFIPDKIVGLLGKMNGDVFVSGSLESPLVNGTILMDSGAVYSNEYGAEFKLEPRSLKVENNRLTFDNYAIYTTSKNPFTINGYVDFREINRPILNLNMSASNYTLVDAKRTTKSLLYGKIMVDVSSTLNGPLDELVMRGNINLLGSTDATYVLTDSPLTVQDRLGNLVTFTSFKDTTVVEEKKASVSLGGLDMNMAVSVDQAVRLKADLTADRSSRVELEGGGNLTLKYTPQGDLTLSGRYTLSGGLLKYNFPIIKAKEFHIDNGSYVEWNGNMMDPVLNFKATDRIRASVSDDNNQSRMVNFDVSVLLKNRVKNISMAFDVSAPEDATIENELTAMGAEERGKQAVALAMTGSYLGTQGFGKGGGGPNLNMGSALNSVLMGQINSLVGNIKNANLSFGVDEQNNSVTGDKRTDYSFRYSQRFFNNRFQIIIGGKVSTGSNATNDAESFIDNVSLEYRLDGSGTRYIRLYYDKNYESVLEGEITETGVGVVLRKKLDRLSELFIFKKKK